MAFAPLPGILVQWPQVQPTAPDAFVQYNVKRRDSGTTAWTRIATIAALGTTSYTDYTPASGTLYDYTVTWTSNRSGNQFESPEGPPATTAVTFAGSFIHDATRQGVNALAYYAELKGNQRGLEPRQTPTIVSVWGRQRPTITFGTGRAKHLSYQLISTDPTDPAVWLALETLQQRQQTLGSPLCVRTEFGDRLFCAITRLVRTDPPYEYLPAIDVDELHFLEAT